jgi:hypothetical protein
MHKRNIAEGARPYARVKHRKPVATLLLEVRGNACRVRVVEEGGEGRLVVWRGAGRVAVRLWPDYGGAM